MILHGRLQSANQARDFVIHSSRALLRGADGLIGPVVADDLPLGIGGVELAHGDGLEALT